MRPPQRLARWQIACAALGVLAAASGSPVQTEARGQAPAVQQLLVEQRTAELPGVHLSYWDTGGTGQTVILLHAGVGSSQVWEHQIPAFTKAGYRLVAYDRRGYGRTVVQPGGPAASAADDLDALATHLKIDRFHLVGTAAGGIVATDYVLSFASRLRSLVIANSLVGVRDEEYLAVGRRLRPAAFNTLPPDFRELGPAYRAANPEGTARWLELEKISRAPGPPALQPSKNRITFAALETIRVPTLLMTGDADLYTPPPALQMVAQRMPHAEVVALRAVGHSAFWEQPGQFNEVVLRFIGKH